MLPSILSFVDRPPIPTPLPLYVTFFPGVSRLVIHSLASAIPSPSLSSSLPFPFQPQSQSQFHCSHSCVVVSKFNRYTPTPSSHPHRPWAHPPSYLTYIYVLHPLTSPVSFRFRLPLASPCIFCFFTQQAFGDPNPGSVHLYMTLLVD